MPADSVQALLMTGYAKMQNMTAILLKKKPGNYSGLLADESLYALWNILRHDNAVNVTAGNCAEATFCLNRINAKRAGKGSFTFDGNIIDQY